MLKEWNGLPTYMKTDAVWPYYEKLKKKRTSLFFKRIFDVFGSFTLIIILSPVLIILSIIIVSDSEGGVFFRQERITQYGRPFRIHKFRTMISGADQLGSQVTLKNDNRITNIGAMLRKYRLDELPQLIDIFVGNMSFVGTRPEVPKYVRQYSPEMFATLLLPAGVTSEASIKYKNEDKLLEDEANVDDIYVNKILPEKMRYNLNSIEKFSFFGEVDTMIKTIVAIIK